MVFVFSFENYFLFKKIKNGNWKNTFGLVSLIKKTHKIQKKILNLGNKNKFQKYHFIVFLSFQ